MIQILINSIAGKTVSLTQKTTDSLLKGVQFLVKGSLSSTGDGLDLLSNAFFYKPEWRDALQKLGVQVKDKGIRSNEEFQKTIELTNEAFDKALFKVELTAKKSDDMVFDNRMVSSILGSSHNQKFKLTKIDMSFRTFGKDITAKETITEYLNSGKTKSVLFLPGLFTDETVWQEQTVEYKDRKITSPGLATELAECGYFSFYLRYNHGLPIHENGKKLMHLLDVFFEENKEIHPDIICYSLGCLIFRSCMYHAKLENKPWITRLGKITLVAAPNKGSYLEKIGFWLGFLFEKSPNVALKIIGMIGNLRSDAIKDLSFGLIRKEEKGWKETISGYFAETYFGELDDLDVYQAYALMEGPENPLQNFLGDGIVEKKSLTYLTDKVFDKKPNPALRTLELKKQNHFSIISSRPLIHWVKEVFGVAPKV
ncbi:MAG: hypothetical protein IBJ01_13110 [Leptospira sp.]|uniref:esterase/lipase family protein n=1 Tax=Leptospira sp. TaxID=178 RepID=UPI0025B9365B|nr:hypothetical protein [Leptospira sp.]MBL0955702.1 hypothetical protein [Leptospira sp.]